ncbi:hypothetical protein C8R44DRAFT_761303 [Mycena epipterygia]|nr:hypothetical protein C8R44DRAFT_761303 [Mycena epipterygia]
MRRFARICTSGVNADAARALDMSGTGVTDAPEDEKEDVDAAERDPVEEIEDPPAEKDAKLLEKNEKEEDPPGDAKNEEKEPEDAGICDAPPAPEPDPGGAKKETADPDPDAPGAAGNTPKPPPPPTPHGRVDVGVEPWGENLARRWGC